MDFVKLLVDCFSYVVDYCIVDCLRSTPSLYPSDVCPTCTSSGCLRTSASFPRESRPSDLNDGVKLTGVKVTRDGFRELSCPSERLKSTATVTRHDKL